MALFETVLVSDLKKPLQVKALTGNLFSADNNGNKITVSVMDNGTAAQISGNVTGYVIRADGKTVIVEGELVGNMASIVLPASAYTVIGGVSIVIKVGSTTVGACTSNVYRTTTDEIVDPGHVVPDITELLEKIAECEAATEAAMAAATAAGYVDIDMSKTGKTITVSITNKNNQTKTQTIVEPTITVTESDGTVTITAVDADGTTTVSYDITPIDDTAGDGDTDKVWSADKLMNDVMKPLSTIEQSKADIITVTDSVSEPVKTLTDGANGVPMGIQIAVEPVQDLHGYQNPWPAGGYKNMVPGIEQGAINTTGTKTGNTARVRANDYILVAGGATYTFNAVASATLQVMVYQYADDQHTERINTDADWKSIPYTFTTLSTANYVTVAVRKSNNTDLAVSDVSDFQLEAGSSATDYAPYSNICPISGWTGANVTRAGRNLFDGAFTTKSLISDTGSVSTNNDHKISTNYIPVKASSSYTISGKDIHKRPSGSSSTTNTFVSVARYRADKSFIDRAFSSQTSDLSYAFETTEETAYVRFTVSIEGYDVQVEYGQEASEYTPFVSADVYPITFPSEAGTVYGGTLTVNKDGTGSLTVNRKAVELPAVESISDSTKAGSTGKLVTYGAYNDAMYINGTATIMFENAKGTNYANSGNAYTAFINSSKFVNLYVPTSATVEEVNNAMQGSKLVYRLATPITIPLTAPQVKSLLGVNNLYADTGDILSVDYSADTKLYVDNLFASLTNATGVSF